MIPTLVLQSCGSLSYGTKLLFNPHVPVVLLVDGALNVGGMKSLVKTGNMVRHRIRSSSEGRRPARRITKENLNRTLGLPNQNDP